MYHYISDESVAGIWIRFTIPIRPRSKPTKTIELAFYLTEYGI